MYSTTFDQPQATDGRILLNPSLLKDLRKRRALSQEALADLCLSRQLCVSIASIKRAETGKMVLYRTARHLASVFEVKLDQLLIPVSRSVSAQVSATAAPSVQGPADLGTATCIDDGTTRYVVEMQVALSFAYAIDSPALKTVAQIAQQFGGQLLPPSAGILVIVFGHPQAYRSDAERCLCCALALRHSVFSGQAQVMLIRPARWHGRTQGRHDDVTLNAAMRWPQLPDTNVPIYVADSLSRQLATRFAFAAVKRGVTPGLRYCLFERALAYGDSAHQPLIGRHTQICQFKVVINMAEQYQSGHLLYLRGMAGLGKTRLAMEFADIARQQHFQCHHCDILDNGTDNWLTILGRLACSLLELTNVDSGLMLARTEIVDTAASRLASVPEWKICYRVLAGVPLEPAQQALYAEMSADMRRHNMVMALHSLILQRAVRRPLLLTIEDLHWGDTQLFEALGALWSLTNEAPVVWVVTARMERDPLEDTLRHHLGDLALSIFDLAPLSNADAVILASQFDDVDAGHRQRCVARAQGHPLFLTQLLASPENALPDSLRHLVQARLDDLGAEHRNALRMAAVLGNDFELTLLRQAIGAPEYQPHDAGRNCLVRRSGTDRYRFVHDLVMHCIYDAIEPALRKRFHRTVAHLLGPGEQKRYALHLYRSGDQAAGEAMLGAIEAELAAYRFDAAMELGELLASATSEPVAQNARLSQLRARTAVGLGQIESARDHYVQALKLVTVAQEHIAIVIGLAAVLNVLDEVDEEQRLLDTAIPLARALRDDAALARLLCLKGNMCFPRGEFAGGRRWHEEAVRYARSGGTVETEVQAISGLGDSCYAQGRMQTAYSSFNQCLAMCREHGFLNLEASNRSALASAQIYLGQPLAAVDNALGAVRLARQVGHHRAEMVAHLTAGWALLGQGLTGQAEASVRQGLTLSRSLGAVRFEPFLMESMARVLWLQGRTVEAVQEIATAAEMVERFHLHGFIGPWVFGTLALLTDDASVRRQALARAEIFLDDHCVAHNMFRFFVSAAETALLDGNAAAAMAYVERLALSAVPESCAWLEYHLSLLRLHAQCLQGGIDEPTRVALADLRERGKACGFSHCTPRLYRQWHQLQIDTRRW